jgi:hypothetical protein
MAHWGEDGLDAKQQKGRASGRLTSGTESPSQPSHPPPSHTFPSQASKEHGRVSSEIGMARKRADFVAGLALPLTPF